MERPVLVRVRHFFACRQYADFIEREPSYKMARGAEMSGAHSILAPSSAARWVVCAGSVMLEAMYPESDEDKVAAAEGTAAHWAGSEMLAGRLVDVGQVAPNDIVLTEEMIDAAELYVEAVDAALAGRSRNYLHIEEKIEIPSVNVLNWGTSDLWFYFDAERLLNVVDFKFGHGFVDEFENWQLIDYAAGILDSLGIDGLDDQAVRVNLTVVQPRSYHRNGPVRTWSVLASDLRPYINKLRNAAEAALMTGAKCKPNPECLHCKARHACEALQIDAYRSAQISAGSVPVDLTPAALGLELHFLRAAAKRLEGRITGLEEQTRQQIGQGVLVPFFAVESVEGRETWAKPVPEVLELGQLFGVNLAKNEAITPKQAVKAGLPAEVLSAYTQRSRGLQLVADDGKQARKVFGGK